MSENNRFAPDADQDPGRARVVHDDDVVRGDDVARGDDNDALVNEEGDAKRAEQRDRDLDSQEVGSLDERAAAAEEAARRDAGNAGSLINNAQNDGLTS